MALPKSDNNNNNNNNIRTQLDLRKPDLLAYRNYIIYIIDTQISTDTIDTDTKYRQKN